MNISKKTQYGLRAMIYLAKKENKKKLSPLRSISEQEGIPFDFLEKILGDLEKTKLVKGKKGIGGGYILAKKSEQITANDIVKILEDTKSVDCSFCGKSKKCASKNVWKKIDLAIDKTLKSITLASLAK